MENPRPKVASGSRARRRRPKLSTCILLSDNSLDDADCTTRPDLATKNYVDNATATGGGSASAGWLFSTDLTASDPGAGEMRFDSATASSVTKVYISSTADDPAQDASFIFLQMIVDDLLIVQQNDDNTKNVVLKLASQPVNNTGWWTFDVTFLQAGTGGVMDDTKATTVGFVFESAHRRNNFAATTDPLVTDDTDLGYEVGSVWLNSTTPEFFGASDVSAGAAVWTPLNSLIELAAHEAAADPHTGYSLADGSRDFTGNVNVPTVPTANAHATAKIYVNTQDQLRVLIADNSVQLNEMMRYGDTFGASATGAGFRSDQVVIADDLTTTVGELVQYNSVGGTAIAGSGIFVGDVLPVLGRLDQTGLILGGTLGINGGDNTLFDIADGAGRVVDAHTDATAPVVTPVSWSGLTGLTVTNLLTQDQTFISIDSTGSVVQRVGSLDPEDFRDEIFLGELGHSAGVVAFAVTAPHISFNRELEIVDYLTMLGTINAGNEYAPNGTNLNVDKSAGKTAFP